MSHSHKEHAEHPHADHPVAGFVFLVLVVAGLGLMAQKGLAHSREVALKREMVAAVEAGQSGEYKKAQELLEKALVHHPDDVNLLFNLGIAYLAQENDAEADKTFGRVLALKADDWDAVAERAGIRERGGKSDEAMQLLESIPVGKGKLAERLVRDPLWAGRMGEPRMIELLKKHGLPTEPADTTVRNVAPEPPSTNE